MKKFTEHEFEDYLAILEEIVGAQKIEAAAYGDTTMTIPIYDPLNTKHLNRIRERFLSLGYNVFFTQNLCFSPSKPDLTPLYMTLTWW